jgi:hypothetical protein
MKLRDFLKQVMFRVNVQMPPDQPDDARRLNRSLTDLATICAFI